MYVTHQRAIPAVNGVSKERHCWRSCSTTWAVLTLLVAISVLSSVSVFAASLFKECERAFSEKGFEQLEAFYERHSADLPTEGNAAMSFEDDRLPKIYYPNECLRLSDSKYLSLVRGTIFVDGLYLIDTKKDTVELQALTYPLPNLKVDRVFGGAGSQYLLMKWDNLHHGILYGGYAIFNLVRPKEASFKFYDLLFFDESDDGLCGNFSSDNPEGWAQITTGTATHLESYRIINEGTANVALVFFTSEQDCKTLERQHVIRTYGIIDGTFTLISAENNKNSK
jgi:hypothetical protein